MIPIPLRNRHRDAFDALLWGNHIRAIRSARFIEFRRPGDAIAARAFLIDLRLKR